MTTLTITIDTDKWAVVPRVPTREMIDASGYDYCVENVEAFAAMLAAAPRPEPVQHLPVATVLGCERYGVRFSLADWEKLNALPKGARLYVEQPAPRPGFAEQLEIKTLSTQLNAVTELLRAREREIADLKKEAPRPVPTSERTYTKAEYDAEWARLGVLIESHMDDGDWLMEFLDLEQPCFHYRRECRLNREKILNELGARPVTTAIPTSERLPTEADADFESNVAAFDGMCWFLVHWSTLYSAYGKKAYTHWQRTNLKRPPAPGEEG